MQQCHQRAADLILYGCLKNGGLYIKLGQGLVSMNHVLPKPYLNTLEVLQNRAIAHRDKGEVSGSQLDEELNHWPWEIWL